MQRLLNIYRFIFCRKQFYKLNYHIHKLSLRGVGVLNSEGPAVTGESYYLQRVKQHFPIETIIDVGANTGGVAGELRLYFPKAKIYAIEPHPKTFKLLKSNAKKNKVLAFNVGLGNRTGKSKLYDFADDAILKHTQPTSTLATTVKNVIEDLHKQKAQAFEFQMTTLDNFAKKENIDKIDFLKIDTEGNELDVLKGAKNLLHKKKISLIQFEFNEMHAYSRTFFKDFMDILPNHVFYRIMPRGLYKLEDYKPNTHEIFAFQNILAVPNDMETFTDKI